MVTTVTSLGRSGLFDWVIQRVTALVLAAYTIYLVAFILMTPEMTYEIWSNLFAHFCMRVFSFLALLSALAHGWIGLWTVLTDYITDRMVGSKATFLRAVTLAIYALVNVICLVWGVEILWGINK